MNSSTLYISTDSTKMTFENVGPETARLMLKEFWRINKGESIIVHNEYFLNHDQMLKKIPKRLLEKLKFNKDDPDAIIASLMLKFNEDNQDFELYTVAENTFIMKSKDMEDVLVRLFSIQYPEGYEKARIEKSKTK